MLKRFYPSLSLRRRQARLTLKTTSDATLTAADYAVNTPSFSRFAPILTASPSQANDINRILMSKAQAICYYYSRDRSRISKLSYTC
jgi:hypothetical protein